jgi:hypothetical protein
VLEEIKIKSIISRFLRTPLESIEHSTVIDKSVFQGSVIFARMISKINEECKSNVDGNNFRTYNDLLAEIRKTL